MQANSYFRAARIGAGLVPLLVTAPEARAQSDIAFPPSVYAERRARLAATLGESVIVIPGRYLVDPADGLIKQDANFWYLTGVESPYAILVMRVGPPNGPAPRVRSYLFLPTAYQFAGGQLPMLDEPFRRAVWNRPRRRLIPGPESARLTRVDATIPVDSFVSRFREIASGAATVYLPEGPSLYAPPGLPAPKSIENQLSSQLATLLPDAKFADAAPAIAGMRLIKDTYEIDGLRRAAQISATGMREAMTKLRPGMNDREPGTMMVDVIKVAAHVFQKYGLEQYEDVAKMGEDKVWGIMPSPTHYLTRDAGIVRYSRLGRGVRDLGHHIGLEATDGRDYSKPLAPGMVITIEPKMYIPEKNIAIMIEDMILVTATGHENLSASLPKRAADIERLMGGRRAR